MQGTDAHVPGGGDILARCAIALCRSRGVSFLGWMKENVRLEFGPLPRKQIYPLKNAGWLEDYFLFEMVPFQVTWLIFMGARKKSSLPLEALQHLLFDAILPPKLIWIIFHFFLCKFFFSLSRNGCKGFSRVFFHQQRRTASNKPTNTQPNSTRSARFSCCREGMKN